MSSTLGIFSIGLFFVLVAASIAAFLAQALAPHFADIDEQWEQEHREHVALQLTAIVHDSIHWDEDQQAYVGATTYLSENTAERMVNVC